MAARWLGIMVLLLVSTGCRQPAPSPATADPASSTPQPAAGSGASAGPVSVDFQNVHFRLGPGIVLEVRHLQGALISQQEGSPPVFDDVSSYVLRIDAGEVAMTPASLTALLNNRVFNYKDAPITGVEVSIENGRLKQKGTLHKGVAVPFTIVADVAAADGRIRVHPVSVKVVGMPASALMNLFRLDLEDLVSSNKARGFEFRDDDMLLIPDRLLPEPRISGRLSRVHLERDRIVEIFGASAPAHATGGVKNYMHFRGNLLRFGRLTMRNTDLRLIDTDPADPFDFSPREYLEQLVAGYSKTAPDGSLRAYMPDFDQRRARR